METFKTFLFGISGISMIFWVAVIGIWHVDMFPRIFKDENREIQISTNKKSTIKKSPGDFIGSGALRPEGKSIGLTDRFKYSRKAFVVADFSPIEAGYGVNRLYTSLLLSLGAMSFILITYGLHSGFGTIGL